MHSAVPSCCGLLAHFETLLHVYIMYNLLVISLISFQVFSTSTGLTKTVYNPAALKAGQKGGPFGSTAVSAEDALKRKQVCINVLVAHFMIVLAVLNYCKCGPVILHQETLKLQHDVRKKKHEILEKHIQTQKVRH